MHAVGHSALHWLAVPEIVIILKTQWVQQSDP